MKCKTVVKTLSYSPSVSALLRRLAIYSLRDNHQYEIKIT